MYRTNKFKTSGPKRSFNRGSRPHGGSSRGSFSDVSRFINKAEITEKVEHFVPEHAFVDFLFDPKLTKAIIDHKYTLPTPIQDRVIPHIIRGEDVVGIANTGTGKTAAFLLPLVNKVLADRKQQVIIVVPTRELASQIQDELRAFTPMMQIFSVCVVGGVPITRQINQLKYHNSFVIGTPGRIKDLMERKLLNISKFNSIVLDEADRMLDMGFIHDMKFIMQQLPAVRQTLFFSATMSHEVEGLIKQFLKNPVSISVKTGDTSKNVDQDVVRTKGKNKLDVLYELLAQGDFTKVLIFAKTKHGAERLSKTLIERGFKAESIHGNKNQSKRQKALNSFKDSQVQILVATDVAARGLDVNDVSHVINYDLPATYDDYVHRIGRTGRGAKKGKALTFVE